MLLGGVDFRAAHGHLLHAPLVDDLGVSAIAHEAIHRSLKCLLQLGVGFPYGRAVVTQGEEVSGDLDGVRLFPRQLGSQGRIECERIDPLVLKSQARVRSGGELFDVNSCLALGNALVGLLLHPLRRPAFRMVR